MKTIEHKLIKHAFSNKVEGDWGKKEKLIMQVHHCENQQSCCIKVDERTYENQELQF